MITARTMSFLFASLVAGSFLFVSSAMAQDGAKDAPGESSIITVAPKTEPDNSRQIVVEENTATKQIVAPKAEREEPASEPVVQKIEIPKAPRLEPVATETAEPAKPEKVATLTQPQTLADAEAEPAPKAEEPKELKPAPEAEAPAPKLKGHAFKGYGHVYADDYVYGHGYGYSRGYIYSGGYGGYDQCH